tara:strand:+ start:961 stop:1716 length:756 start_codon:yes stop_codon:yes gene_type:complete
MKMEPILDTWRQYIQETNVARAGMDREVAIAVAMNEFFLINNLELVAKAAGGAGHGSDIEVSTINGELVDTYEVKTSKGSRIDFGQFRLSHDAINGWQQATARQNDVIKAIFAEIKDILDTEVVVQGAPFPPGPSMSTEMAAEFWESALGRPREKSLSGDVIKIPVSPNFIQDYYRKKGDEYIILGDDVYSLASEGVLMSLSEALKECLVVFRIKYHSKNKFSYTVAIRGKFIDTAETDFARAMKKIYLSA